MHQNKEYEAELSIRDMWFHLLYHWRSIVLCALICALIFGGYAFLKNRNTQPKTNAPEVPDVQAADTAAGDDQNQALEGNTAIYQNLLDGALQYQRNSLLLRLNPYCLWKSSAVYTVVMDNEATEKAQSFLPGSPVEIANSYRTAICTKPDINALQSIYGNADLQYILEMFTFTTDIDPESENAGSAVELLSTFVISAYGKDKNQAEAGLSYYKKIIEEYSGANPQEMGKHHLVYLNEFTIQTTDRKLEKKQALVAQNLASYQSTFIKSKKELEATEKKATEEAISGTNSLKKAIAKWAIIGFLAGAFLAVILWLIEYVKNNTLKETSELSDQYNLPVFGEFTHSRAKMPGKGLDKLIENWEFKHAGTNEKDIYSMIGSWIREQQDTNSILLISTLNDSKLSAIHNQIASMNQNRSIELLPDFLHSNNGIEKVNKADIVIVAEEKYVSRMADISHMAEWLNIAGVDVKGAIIF